MNFIKRNRVASFIAVATVYALALVFGIFLYRALELEWWLSLLIADIAATVFVFIFSLIFKNASVYDPYWSVQPIAILASLALSRGANLYSLLLLGVISLWGIRLTLNWAYTFKNLSWQDWRYTMLSESTGRLYPLINLLGIHMVPTLVVYGCVLPAAYSFFNAGACNLFTYICLGLSLVSALLQGISDVQMHAFKRRGAGGFIREGLWKYCRHPNYLGEIMMWWGVGLSALSVFNGKWYLLSGALANTLLFFFISIPMADKRQSRKTGYEEYRKATRSLIPIKKRIK